MIWRIAEDMNPSVSNLILKVLISVLCLGMAIGCARTQVQIKSGLNLSGKRMGVLPFYSTAPDVGAAVSDSLATNLMEAEVTIIERTYLQNTLAEREVIKRESSEPITTPGFIVKGVESLDLPKLNSLNIVDYLLVGTITTSMSSTAVSSYGFMGSGVSRMSTLGGSARIIDVRTGEVVLSLSYSPATIYDVPYDIGKTMAKAIKKKLRSG